jgi:hypothetical protein
MSETVILDDNAVAEIEARANAATEGPWRWRRDYEMPDGDKHWELSNPDGDRNRKTIDASLVLLLDRDEWLHRPAETQANWEFIAHAREDIPALCQTVRALRAECDKWQRRAKAFQEGYKDKSFEVTGLEIQKMDLLAHGADKVVVRQNESLRTKLLGVCVERNELREQLAAVTQERDALSLALKKELERPLR